MDRLWIGLERYVHPDPANPRSALGVMIDVATHMRWGTGLKGGPPRTGWTFKEGPATHAFVVYCEEHAGVWWRVDSGFPSTRRTLWEQPTDPTVLWEVLAVDGVCVEDGIRAAKKSEGTEYGWEKLVLQAVAPLAPPAVNAEIPYQCSTRPICTEHAMRVLAACGGDGKSFADLVLDQDFYPEEIGLRIRDMPTVPPWLNPRGELLR